MLQQQAFGSSGREAAIVPVAEAFVSFSPESAVRGIIYHLVDEKLGKSVAPDTARRTIERLAGRSFQPRIPRSRWGQMTNPQRLEWLLSESQTLTVMSDDEVIMLRARRSR